MESGRAMAFAFISKLSKKLILLGLIGFFVTKTTTSIFKLMDEEVGTLFKSKYSNQILYPSMTVCKVIMDEWKGETFPKLPNISSILLQIAYWQQLGNR
jgi:hypothetical protein